MSKKKRAQKIKMILMDVDGTLTDGTLTLLPDGEELKGYHVWDGLGIIIAQSIGIKTGIITGKTSQALTYRAERLKIQEIHQGIRDKKAVLLEIAEKYRIHLDQIAFIGDDLGDLQVMQSVGLAAAVADAHPDIKKNCHFLCSRKGGQGAVREFIEFIIKAQNRWDSIMEKGDF